MCLHSFKQQVIKKLLNAFSFFAPLGSFLFWLGVNTSLCFPRQEGQHNEKKMSSLSNKKIVISGSNIDFYQYERSFLYGPNVGSSRKIEAKTGKQVLNLESLKKHAYNRRRYFTNLVNTNAYSWASSKSESLKFVTLTFAGNMSNPRKANKYYTLFIKRLDYFLFPLGERSLKYVTILEFQKRGALHYHSIFFNLPYLSWKKLNTLWGKGFVFIQRVDRIKDLGHYVTKDMVKSFDDPRLYKQKRYFRSDGLHEPQIIYGREDCDYVSAVIPPGTKVFHRSYETDYLGLCNYSHYVLKKNFSFDGFLRSCQKTLMSIKHQDGFERIFQKFSSQIKPLARS